MTDMQAVNALLQLFRNSPAHDRTVCDRLLMDLWFHDLAARIAAALLRRHHAPVGWKDDLVQQVMLTLEQSFVAGVDPKLDLSSAADFVGSLRRLIFRHSRRALRALLRQYDHPLLRVDPSVDDESAAHDDVLDLCAAIDRLGEPQRSVIVLHCRGRSLEDIAEELNLLPWRVHHLLDLGKAELSRRLADHELRLDDD